MLWIILGNNSSSLNQLETRKKANDRQKVWVMYFSMTLTNKGFLKFGFFFWFKKKCFFSEDGFADCVTFKAWEFLNKCFKAFTIIIIYVNKI